MSTRLIARSQAQHVTAPLDSSQSANFTHLYWDIAWFGIAFGSTLSFLPVFAARLGASGWQIALLSAGPALVGIIFTLPMGRWLQRQSEENRLGNAVTKAAIWQRIGYLCLVPLPLVIPASSQLWAVLLLTFLMAIPGTILLVGFNALLAATVPPEARGQVVGRRNALLAGAIMVSFIASGWVLDRLSFEAGYTVIFALGAVGAMMSAYHVSRIKAPPTPYFEGRPLQEHAQAGQGVGYSGGIPQRLTVGLRLMIQHRPTVAKVFGEVSGPFWWAIGALFLFHFTQLLPTALFPLFWVNEAQLSDGQIGWLNASMYLAMLVVSPLLGPLTRRFGNYRLMVAGALMLFTYPLVTAISSNFALLLIGSMSGGAVWAILSGAQINRLLELSPVDRRPSHMALYNLAFSFAMLTGVMLGPLLAGVVGLREALLMVALLRIGSGFALARWG